MKELSSREKREIRALVDSSHEAMIEVVKTLRAMQVRRQEAKALRLVRNPNESGQ